MYTALITDVDGTLCPREELSVSPAVREAIRQLQMSALFTIATSRALLEVKPLIDTLHLTEPVITSGGALVSDPQTKAVYYERSLSKQSIDRIRQTGRDLGVDLGIHTPDGYVSLHEDVESTYMIYTYLPVDRLKVAVIMKALEGVAGIDARQVASEYPDRDWVLITHPEATKQHGIIEFAQQTGVDRSQIVGVGDSYNDFPLLMACGLKVAMGNAPDELKAIADYVAPSVEQDGLAEVIRRFLL